MRVKCFDGGAHLFERCTCDDRSCRTWLCVACGHIIDRKQKQRGEGNAEFDRFIESLADG